MSEGSPESSTSTMAAFEDVEATRARALTSRRSLPLRPRHAVKMSESAAPLSGSLASSAGLISVVRPAA